MRRRQVVDFCISQSTWISSPLTCGIYFIIFYLFLLLCIIIFLVFKNYFCLFAFYVIFVSLLEQNITGRPNESELYNGMNVC